MAQSRLLHVVTNCPHLRCPVWSQMTEPECKCDLWRGSHSKDCAWKAWKDGGKKPGFDPPMEGIFKNKQPKTTKTGLLNMSVIDPSLGIQLRVLDVITMQALCDSIRKKGILIPICVAQVSSGKYKIIDGRHRYKAAKTLGYIAIPADIVPLP